MKKEVFQAALAATARVACCAALVSCQKPVHTTDGSPPLMEHAAQKEEKPAEQTIPKQPIVPKTSEAFASCNQTIDNFVKNSPSDEQSVPEEVIACCTLQLDEYEQRPDFFWKNQMDCCAMLNWRSRGCTPWGPPTPPHMSA